VNVWLALAHNRHSQHITAKGRFEAEAERPVFFCRFTQLVLLRLLTNSQVMGRDVVSQREAWRAYDRMFEDSRIEFLHEPGGPDVETHFRNLSSRSQPSTKIWADAFLAAFARAAGLTIVTFDRALRSMAGPEVIVLEGVE